MKTICKVPLTLTVNARDWRALAMLAFPFDEIIIEFPNAALDRERILQLVKLIGKPVWILPETIVSQLQDDTPAKAYDNHIKHIDSVVNDAFTLMRADSHLLKGFAFDHADFYRKLGRLNTTEAKFFDGEALRSQIQAAHRLDLPCMIISGNIPECVANIYVAESEFPYSARWGSILGGDSEITDWLIANDVFFSPPHDDYGNIKLGVTDTYAFTDHSSAIQKFMEALPVLKTQAELYNIRTGVLQSLDMSSADGDTTLAEGVSTQQKRFTKGLSTFLQMTDLDGFGFTGIGSGAFLPSFKNVSDVYELPLRSGQTRIFSANGAIYCDYLSADSPVRIVTNQIFEGFALFRQQ